MGGTSGTGDTGDTGDTIDAVGDDLPSVDDNDAPDSAIALDLSVLDGIKVESPVDRVPPGRPTATPDSRPIRPTKFPTPQFRKYTTDAKDSAQRPSSAMRWVARLPVPMRDRCMYYVYRNHPVLKEPEVDPETGKPKRFKYIDRVYCNDPNLFIAEEDLLNRYGCGRYTLYLNEVDVAAGEEGRTILTIFAHNLGGGDYRAHPPNDELVCDPNNVDLDHPDNRGYRIFLTSIGKLPEQMNAEKEKQEMATATVVDQLTTGYKDMADRVIKMAEGKANTPPKPEASPESAIFAAKGLMDAAGETMQRAATMAIEQSKGMGLAEVLQVAKELSKGEDGTKAQVDMLTNRLLDMQTQQIEALNRRLDSIATAAAANSAAPASASSPATDPFAYFDKGVDALKRMKNAVDELGGGSRAVDDAVDAAGGPAWLKTAATAMPFVAQILTGAVRAYELSRMAPGTVPPPAQPMPPMPTQPAPVQSPGAAPTPAPSTASPSPAAISAPAGELNVPALIYSIQMPLLNHINMPDLTGADFADWFIGGYGLEVFAKVKEYGPFLETALREHTIETPNGMVKPFSELSRLSPFVAEFLAFDPSKDELIGAGL